MRNYYNYFYPAIQPKRAIFGRHLKLSLLLVERKRCAGEFLLISVSSSHARSLSCSLLVQVMTCASWMMPPVTQVRSPHVSVLWSTGYLYVLCSLVLGSQLLSSWHRRLPWISALLILVGDLCLCVRICIGFCSLLVSWAKIYHLQEVQMSSGFLCAFILQPVFRESRLLTWLRVLPIFQNRCVFFSISDKQCYLQHILTECDATCCCWP